MCMMVSISCATYNQEGYIAQALDGFLMQETNFDFEILVHDDASTDGTTTIIREYERRHPGIIKPIYQTENQYSKGIRIGPLNAARAQGKYVALCEGDDYWVDAQKLQKQVDLMEANPGCSLSVHSSLKVSPEGEPVGEVRPARSDRMFTTAEILARSPGLFSTSSLLFPAALYSALPDYYYECPVGDWPLILFLSSKGDVRYIDRQMSAYRTHAVNSWTRSIRRHRPMQIEFNRGMRDMYLAFDRATGQRNSAIVARMADKHDFRLALLERSYDMVRQPRYSGFYKELGLRSRAVITLRRNLPWVAAALAQCKCSVRTLIRRRPWE